MVRSGDLTPRITQRHPLEDAGEALAAIADRSAVGRIVVDVG